MNYLKKKNKLHPTLKLTMAHTTVKDEPMEDRCKCEPCDSIPFLDTSIIIENGRIEVDL